MARNSVFSSKIDRFPDEPWTAGRPPMTWSDPQILNYAQTCNPDVLDPAPGILVIALSPPYRAADLRY